MSPTTGYLKNVYTMQKTTKGGVTWTTIDSVSGIISCTGMYWLNANEGFAVFSENLGFGIYTVNCNFASGVTRIKRVIVTR